MILGKGDDLCRIVISEPSVTIRNSDVKLRDAELGMLKICIEQSAIDAPKIPEVRQRMKMLDDLENITDTDNYIDLSKSDIELIKKTFEASAGRRYNGWLRCARLLDQIEKPTLLSDWLRSQSQQKVAEEHA